MTILKLTEPVKGIYLVDRTSTSGKPCDGAYQVQLQNVDCRCVDSPEKLSATEDWYAKGTNHRVVDGKICRDLGWRTCWAISAPSIEDFVSKHGQCVVSQDSEGFISLEIYDDYRE